MPESFTPAILFTPASFGTAEQDPIGRVVANRNFLEGLIKYGDLEMLYGYTTQQAQYGTAFEQLARDLGATMPVRVIDGHQQNQLAEVGGLAICDPNIVAFARQRSFVDPRSYALTGLTHTLADFPPMAMLAELAIAPVQPWDALVCTARAAAAMVNEMLRAEEERLAERLGATRFPRPLLPVIPLGVDTHRFAAREDWRAAWRERLGIGAEEVAILYVGRLSRHGKAHPLPMMAALGRAVQTQPYPLHLILAGWWLHPPEEAIWREQASALCPEVRLHVLDGREQAVRREILVCRGYLHPSGRQRPGDLRPGARRGHGGRAAGSRYRLGRLPRYGTTRGRRDAGADHDGAPRRGSGGVTPLCYL